MGPFFHPPLRKEHHAVPDSGQPLRRGDLPACTGRVDAHREGFHGVDEPQHGDGHGGRRQYRQGVRPRLLGRDDVPEHLHRPRRPGLDRLRLELSRRGPRAPDRPGTPHGRPEDGLPRGRDGRRAVGLLEPQDGRRHPFGRGPHHAEARGPGGRLRRARRLDRRVSAPAWPADAGGHGQPRHVRRHRYYRCRDGQGHEEQAARR